jgi:F-type H+-transporting ATPase subunit delta
MAKITTTEYAQALQLALQESKPEDYDVIVENLISAMRDNGDLDKYEAVVAEYERLLGEDGQIKEVEAVFARQTTANKGLLDELNSIVGPKLEIRTKVDSELVGGMVLRVDDTLIDASVKGQLETIKKELSE